MTSLLCLAGLHTRSRGRARREGAQWVSRCRRCNRPMRRADNGKWRLDLPDKRKEVEVDDVFTDSPEGDQPRRGLRKWLAHIHVPLPFRRKAQD